MEMYVASVTRTLRIVTFLCGLWTCQTKGELKYLRVYLTLALLLYIWLAEIWCWHRQKPMEWYKRINDKHSTPLFLLLFLCIWDNVKIHGIHAHFPEILYSNKLGFCVGQMLQVACSLLLPLW